MEKKPSNSSDMEKLLSEALLGSLVVTRREAIEKLGTLPQSDVYIVGVLKAISECDDNEQVRKTALRSLQAKAHQEIIEENEEEVEREAALVRRHRANALAMVERQRPAPIYLDEWLIKLLVLQIPIASLCMFLTLLVVMIVQVFQILMR